LVDAKASGAEKGERAGLLVVRASATKARLMAARRFQAFYERAEIGGAKAIDITRDVVDGGRAILPDRTRQEAINHNKIGQFGSNLVRRVLGEKRTLVEVAAMLLGVEVPTDQRANDQP
jgi:hypothetical protein